MGLRGMALSVCAVAAGAVLYWFISYQSSDAGLSTAGFTLMLVGGFSFVISAIIFTDSRGPRGNSRPPLSRQPVVLRERVKIVREDATQTIPDASATAAIRERR
jgi:hypothetical protein